MSAPGQEQPVEGAQTTAAPDTASAPSFDMSPVLDRVNELAGSIDTRFGAIEQRLPQPEQPVEPNPWDDLFGPEQPLEGFDQYGQPAQPQQPQMDPQAFQNAVNQAIQQQNAPLLDRLQRFELQQAEQRLYEQIPQLKPVPQGHADYEANQAARTQMATLVQQATANFSPQVAQALLADPNFFVMTWKAAEADRLAQGQAPAGGNAPSLEAAGGALPGGQSANPNPVHQAMGSQAVQIASAFR